ncbi:alpha-mannosidase [Microbacterium ginsengiterrae]|uniref:Alpha-mannosidase n=1 Tax=Microbacterium ginsengiterrae TaxID=546115 RepID=A0A7W9CA41_9MICO|nr:glycoside hydrolase family 38 C-terminal domain-containing protein [Microbacterium ginsengiterrae]MBB5741785.1 alpha-mannosidase [Microbacterium ginsengiterrae]
MHDTTALIEARIRRFVEERLRPRVHTGLTPLSLERWDVPGEPVPFAEAVAQTYEPFRVGARWGRPWGTTWVRMRGTAPQAPGAELLIDLGFHAAEPGFQAEGTVYRSDGTIIKAVEPRNAHVPLECAPGDEFELYLEAAANPDVADGFRLFRPTPLGSLHTAGDEPLYVFRQADIAIRDDEVWELLQDATVLSQLAAELPESSSRRAEILRALERMVDTADPDDISGSAADARAVLVDVLSRPASASAHRVHAVGHAHIDSAWLWPVRETQRKVARTFSNVLSLQQEKDFVFTASSAQQYAWLKTYQPELFSRVRDAVASGRFVPAGGMWVESDTNMPGGEALARQFVRGKRFFMSEFGVEPLDVWLPDSFGYSAALPQIARAAGSRWMLTQKMSWNETNRMPHHTFLWEGTDGTRIFTHFPPVDTYSAQLSGAELARAERQYAEKGLANTSLVPFGYGDGGGGPNREMIAAAERLASLEGSPTVTLSSPAQFFEAAEAEYPNPPVWSGEMYLEFHRGTYTSQARTKRGNRRSEHALREAELWATAATLRGAEYPYEELDALWETVLLQQFHDILPGTSIGWVHREAERRYAEVLSGTEAVTSRALATLTGEGTTEFSANAGPFAQDGDQPLGIVQVAQRTDAAATVTAVAGGFDIGNEHLAAHIDAEGLLSSVVVRASGREVIAPGRRANLLQLHRDTPTQWDAWDIDEHYRRQVEDLTAVVSLEHVPHPTDAVVCVVRGRGATRITQTLTLAAGSRAIDIETVVDWHERQKLLKLAFPLDVHADTARSEIQFGHVQRPTHANTSWDMARFETVAHRWVHVGEPGFGIAVANDATYGHDITRAPRDGGGTITNVRLSLLRAPLFPDPEADQGEHVFRVSLRPDASIEDAVREGYRLNIPARRVVGDRGVEPVVSVSPGGVVVEAVKLAEDRGGDVIVRLYEALGARSSATLSTSFAFDEVAETDLLERALDASAVTASSGREVSLTLRPFQLVTLRLRGARS